MTSELQNVLVELENTPPSTEGSPGRELSSLWYAIAIRPWTTLGVVSPDDPARAWSLVQTLERTARLPEAELRTVNVLDASADRATAICHAISPKKGKAPATRGRFLLATDSPLVNPVAIRVLGACDAVLLVIGHGRSHIPDARRTMTLIGPERVIGAVFALE